MAEANLSVAEPLYFEALQTRRTTCGAKKLSTLTSINKISRTCNVRRLHSGLEVRKETERMWVVRNTFIEADEEEPTLTRKKSLENYSP